jgi:hypothetical protein
MIKEETKLKKCFNKLLNFTSITFGFLFLNLVVLTSFVLANPNVFLGEAIKNAAKLKGNLPTKERLKTYENIFKSLDKIVVEHASSDQAIKILSDQKIGNFDASTLRTGYVKDLTEYYDIVCETSPSYSCLGFVSLKTGNEQCIKASNFEEIIEAHRNLKNAARVFIGQTDNSSYFSLAMDSYRGCLGKSKFKVTQYASDYFTAEILKLLLKGNQEVLTKASIEKMKSPYFKFLGVLTLSAHQKKPFDKQFFSRLDKYIQKKIKDDDGDASMAKLALIKDMIIRSSLPVDAIELLMILPAINQKFGGIYEECNHFYTKNLFELLTEIQTEIISVELKRFKVPQNLLSGLMEMFSGSKYMKFPNKPGFVNKTSLANVLSSCKQEGGGFYDYELMVLLHGQLLIDNLLVAAEFKRRAIQETFSENNQLEFFYDHFGQTKEKFNTLYELINNNQMSPKYQYENIQSREYSKYLIFTKNVDFANVCDASTILFKELKGTDSYDKAIKYMIDSPKIHPEKKYNCGDEDLELLLQ